MTSNPTNDANKSREQLLDELVALRRRVHQADETEAELAQTNQKLQERDHMLAAFQRIGQSTLASLDLETLLDNLGREIILTGVFRSLMIALVDEEAQQVEVVRSLIHRGLVWRQDFASDNEAISPASELKGRHPDVTNFRYDLEDDNITAITARTGQMQVIEEWDQRFDQRFNRPDERRGKVAYFIPVKRKERVLAVLATGSAMADRDEVLYRIEAMQPLLDQAAIALEHARLYEQVLMGRNRMQEYRANWSRSRRTSAAFWPANYTTKSAKCSPPSISICGIWGPSSERRLRHCNSIITNPSMTDTSRHRWPPGEPLSSTTIGGSTLRRPDRVEWWK